ncbi:MAG: hypothetical protein Alpg2KO_17560 [Alphaproteobacteria bacterium]
MHLLDPEFSPTQVIDGIGFSLELGVDVDTLLLDIAVDCDDDPKLVVLFDFKTETGERVEEGPPEVGVSRHYELPFYYIKTTDALPRLITVPEGAERLELHLVNWGDIPVHILRARVFVNTTIMDMPPLVDESEEDVEVSVVPDLDFSQIDQSDLLRIASTPEKLVQLKPGVCYEHSVKLVSLVPAVENHRAAVIMPRFYDEQMRLITDHGNRFSSSDRLGEYVYLAYNPDGSDKPVEFDFPEHAKWFGYIIEPWSLKDLLAVDVRTEQVGLSRKGQTEKLRRELAALENVPADDLVLIYTGTTRIGEKHRANRSMMMAIELAEMGKSVVFVYYRASRRQSILEDQTICYQGGGRVIQVPNDLFIEFSDSVVKMGRNGGSALVTMPDAGSMPLMNHLKANGWQCAYEARDDWEEFHRVGAGRWYDINFERYLARKADFTLSVSPPLREKMIAMGAKREDSHILANGAGARFHEHFATTGSHPVSHVNGTGKIGYFGHLTQKWFDWPALLGLAKANPDTQIEIIGHGQHPEIDLPNVTFLGAMDHAQIIEAAKGWEIGIIPFVPSRLANAVDPIKIYEYLCLRLKVVSVYMEQIANYPNTYTYTHSDELITAVAKAQATAFDIEKNLEFCKACSWANRVEELASRFEGANQ